MGKRLLMMVVLVAVLVAAADAYKSARHKRYWTDEEREILHSHERRRPEKQERVLQHHEHAGSIHLDDTLSPAPHFPVGPEYPSNAHERFETIPKVHLDRRGHEIIDEVFNNEKLRHGSRH